MAAKSIDSESKFNIYSSFTLSNDDLAVVSLLYAPLMGSDALMLYLAFTSLLERNNLRSEALRHQDLFDMYSLKPNDFVKARYKIEAIGLLISYLKDDGSYVYVVCPPLTARSFLKDSTIGLFLYSKIKEETFNFIYEHFKVEKINKLNATNITKSFDEVYQTQVFNDITYDKFKYILGKKPNKNIVIKKYNFSFDDFLNEIDQNLLETGVTRQFKKQILDLSFAYNFDETQMVLLFNESINKNGYFDYKLLKNNANKLFIYNRNINAPKLVTKDTDKESNDFISYLEDTPIADILEDIVPNYPERYLKVATEIYENIELPRGVLNCMIVKVIKDKSGEMPALKYFMLVAQDWIKKSIFTTADAIKYVTDAKIDNNKEETTINEKDKFGGFTVL